MQAHMRRALRVVRMVHELHKQGYQLLRISPGMAPSGCHWRCAITSKENILHSHGAMLAHENYPTARYTSGQGNEYFGWNDAKNDNVQQLAEKFTDRYAQIARSSFGDDWTYAGWYVRMLGFAERELLPIAYNDSSDEPRDGFLTLLDLTLKVNFLFPLQEMLISPLLNIVERHEPINYTHHMMSVSHSLRRAEAMVCDVRCIQNLGRKTRLGYDKSGKECF